MPTGASPKREREYRKLKREFERDHRYAGRESEVAARIVNRQRAEFGETRMPAQAGAQRGGSATSSRPGDACSGADDDHALAIRHYHALTVAQASRRLDGLTARELRQVRRFEEQHRNRRTMIDAIDRRLARAA
jgi:hypothetical protein